MLCLCLLHCITDTFSSESTARGPSPHLIYFPSSPRLHCSKQSLILSDARDQNSGSVPQLCVLIGDYSVAVNTCFVFSLYPSLHLHFNRHNKSCGMFSVPRGVFSCRVLSLREKPQIYVSGWTPQTFHFAGLSGTVLSQLPSRLLITDRV